MKAKKIVALTMSVALTLGAAALFTACDDKDKDKDKDPVGGTYTEDTNVYHCAGQSAGPDANLYNQGWDQTAAGATDKVKFVKDASVTDKNVFTLEMKMYAGDQFKIVHGESWTEEITSYYFTNAEADSTYNYVAKTDGEIIFRDFSSSSSDITLTEGNDGIYKFTLVTDPSASNMKEKYKLSYELVQSIDKLKVPYKMGIMGDINNFNSLNPVAMNNSNGVWSLIVEITEDNLMFDAEGNDADEGEATHSALYVLNYGDGTGEENEKMTFVDEERDTADVTVAGKTYEVNLLPEGKWAITFDQATKTVTINELAYELYFIGGWYADPDAEQNWGWEAYEGYKDYPLTSNADGTIWTGTLDLTAQKGVTEVKLFNSLGTGNKYLPASKPDNYKLEPGKYVFQYNTETDTATFQKYEYYLIGTLVDEGGNDVNFKIKDGVNPVLTATAVAGVYEVEFEVVDAKTLSATYSWLKDNVCALKVGYGTEISGIADSDYYGVGNENVMITQTGTYVIKLDLNAEVKVTATLKTA